LEQSPNLLVQTRSASKMATNEMLEARVKALEMQLAASPHGEHRATQSVGGDVDTFYLMWASSLIFLMQAGFATLSAGSIRSKNVKNILLKNLLDACMGALAWYFFGYAFAFGHTDDSNSAFIGGGRFALRDMNDWSGSATSGDWAFFHFQFTFAAAAATIVSGAVAERCQLGAYLIYTVCITGFIYPVVVHWVWDGKGFLSAGNPDAIMHGCIDFAGSGVVHMTGGWAALMGAKILGPRLGRWQEPQLFEGHSTPLQVIGTFLLWFGWYGFNPGSTGAIIGQAGVAARSTVTTTLSAASAGVTGLFLKRLLPPKFGGSGIYDIGHTCNSLLGGLVAITAGCNVVHPWAAVIMGIIGAFFYHAGSCLMRKLKIDDPLDAFAVHGMCGVWGVLAVGLFTVKEYSFSASSDGPDAGLFMPGTEGRLFATQIVTILIEIPWVVVMSGIMFFILKVVGILRVPPDQETAGLDESKHGGSAYPPDAKGAVSASA